MHKNNVVFILAGAFIILISGCAGSDYYQGKKNLDLGNYGKAIEYFNQEIQLQPNNFKAHRDLGIALYKKNDLSNSLVSLQKAFSIKKNDAFTIFYLGLINEAMKDYDRALNYYKEYINLGLFDEGIKDVIDGRIQWIANKKIEDEVKNALKAEAEIKADSIKENSLGVLYFQNIGTNKDLDPLQKGLTEMLITDLSKVKSLKVIERVKLQKLLQELGLGKSGLVSQESVPRIGKLIGVSKLVKGTFMDMEASNFRIGVGTIGTGSGIYNDLTKVTGNIQNLFKLEKELTFNIINELRIRITDKEREEIQIIPTESYLAFAAYSKGLDLEDQGRYQEASEQYRQAFSADPGFSNAGEKMHAAEVMDKSSDDISKLEAEVVQPNTSTLSDRLNDLNTQLTGETVKGRDDRSPAADNGFGRGVKVDIKIILPPN